VPAGPLRCHSPAASDTLNRARQLFLRALAAFAVEIAQVHLLGDSAQVIGSPRIRGAEPEARCRLEERPLSPSRFSHAIDAATSSKATARYHIQRWLGAGCTGVGKLIERHVTVSREIGEPGRRSEDRGQPSRTRQPNEVCS
jgi:hypothetical protein